MNTQLVAMESNGVAYYGELSDAHVFRCAERRIVMDDLACIPIPADWKAYLDNLPHINIERADGTWVQSPLGKHSRAVQTSKGYMMPVLELLCRDLVKAFPKMLRRGELQPPIQGHVPTALVRSEPKPVKTKQVVFRNEIVPATAPATAPVTVPAKSRKAVSLRRSSISSTDAVSEKAPDARIHAGTRLRVPRE